MMGKLLTNKNLMCATAIPLKYLDVRTAAVSGAETAGDMSMSICSSGGECCDTGVLDYDFEYNSVEFLTNSMTFLEIRGDCSYLDTRHGFSLTISVTSADDWKGYYIIAERSDGKEFM